MDSTNNKLPGNGIKPAPVATSDISLNKAKSAAPFVPNATKKSLKSEAVPFTPAVSSTVTPVAANPARFQGPALSSITSATPFSPEVFSEPSPSFNNANPMLSSNVPTFLTAVPQRRTFATTFLPPQLPLTFERQTCDLLSQESPNDPHYKQIPQRYHSMKVLDTSGTEIVTGSFGYITSLYKVIDSKDGNCYALRRVERVRTNNEMVASVLEKWKKFSHPNVISLCDCYINNGALFFVHEYYPCSTSLYNQFLNDLVPNMPRIHEDILWCICIQLLSALQGIHCYGLACRVLDCKHVLVTERNRYRIGSIGVMDILEPRSNIKECQSKDLSQLGYLLLLLACRSKTVSLDMIHDYYSSNFVTIVQYLLQGQYSASALLSECMPHVVRSLNSAFTTADDYYAYLFKEYTNGKYFRLLMKLCYITDRPDDKGGYSWSDTGDRYILRLFRDYVFHQKDDEGHPIIDNSHVLDALAKVDIGDSETIPLCSPDGKTVLVCSYEDIKRCLDNVFGELTSMTSQSISQKGGLSFTPFVQGMQGMQGMQGGYSNNFVPMMSSVGYNPYGGMMNGMSWN